MEYRRMEDSRDRFLGTVFIAVGAILPGIGGSFTRAGYVEVLYITEFIGIIFIFIGYRFSVSSRSVSIPTRRAQESEPTTAS
jgi:hypothetical protein